MANGPTYRVPFRRRREGRTDFRQRLALLKSGKPRLVVRRQNGNTVVQVIDFAFEGDKILAGASARDLAKFGWTGGSGNEAAAYLAGFLVGTRAKANGVEEAVLDIGLHHHFSGRIRAAFQGALDAGLEIPHGDDFGADEDRATGNHLGDDLPAQVEAVKAKIEEAH